MSHICDGVPRQDRGPPFGIVHWQVSGISSGPPSGAVVVTAGAAGWFGILLADWRMNTKGGF